MPSVTYNYVPDQMVYVITDGTVKVGTVSLIDINITSSGTEITYWILIEDDAVATPFDEMYVFANCREAPGYQDVVYLENLEGTPSPVAVEADNPLFTASPAIATGSPPTINAEMNVLVDGTTSIDVTVSLVVGITFQEIVDQINATILPYATASLVNNNIRITSATLGPSSSILITE